jgi:hypothetical protein
VTLLWVAVWEAMFEGFIQVQENTPGALGRADEVIE